MIREIGRLAPYGVLVSFYLEGTDKLLWKAPMEIIPSLNDKVGHRNNSDIVGTWYKVESVSWEFAHEKPAFHGEPSPEPFPREISRFGVYVSVSVIV